MDRTRVPPVEDSLPGHPIRRSWSWGRDVTVTREKQVFDVDTGLGVSRADFCSSWWTAMVVVLGVSLPSRTRMWIDVDGRSEACVSGAATAALCALNDVLSSVAGSVGYEEEPTTLPRARVFRFPKPINAAAGQLPIRVVVCAEDPHSEDAGPIGLYGLVVTIPGGRQ